MQRDSAIKKIGKGMGFMLMGNLLSGIMVISVAPVIGIWLISCAAMLFTLIIYLSLMFTVGYNDGRRERSLLKNHRVDEAKKSGWLLYGLLPGAVICVPSVIVMLGIFGQVAISGEYMFVFRFLCGTVAPLVYIGGFRDAAIADYPLWFPILSMGIYLLGSPLAAAVGFKFGFDDKVRNDFMYDKSK